LFNFSKKKLIDDFFQTNQTIENAYIKKIQDNILFRQYGFSKDESDDMDYEEYDTTLYYLRWLKQKNE